MLLEASIDKIATEIQIDNPFDYNLEHIISTLEQFTSSQGVSIEGHDIGRLIPKMIRGIAGCEGGCPADAKKLVQNGVAGVSLHYIEGGILSASIEVGNDRLFTLKVFPDFS